MADATENVVAARENRLPDAIFLYLFVLPRGDRRNPILWVLFTAAVSGVLLILADMDRPRRGLIQTDVTPYLRLAESMKTDRRE